LITIASVFVGLILVVVIFSFYLVSNFSCGEDQIFPGNASSSEERTAVADADNRGPKDAKATLDTEETQRQGSC
jgi:hypothetical protein